MEAGIYLEERQTKFSTFHFSPSFRKNEQLKELHKKYKDALLTISLQQGEMEVFKENVMY